MKIRDLVDIDGKNASGQRVSLLNPDKPSSGVRKDSFETQRLSLRPSVVRRQAHSGYGDHEGRSHSMTSSSTSSSSSSSSSNIRRTGYRDHALQLERMYSTGSSSTNSSIASSTSSMFGSRYGERTRSCESPPTPEQDEYMEDSVYDDPDSCATASPYPNFPNHSTSFPFVQTPSTLQPEFRQLSLDSGLHGRLHDLAVRGGRSSTDRGVSPLMPAPSGYSPFSSTTLPSFNQAFSDYVISPNVSRQHSYSAFDRETPSLSRTTSYIQSPHAPPRLSTTSDSSYSPVSTKSHRPPLSLDVQRSDSHPSSHSISSNSANSPQTPGASSDDSQSHSRPRPHPRKSLSSRSASSSNLNKGPSDRHRYPCPLAEEFDCHSYFTTSGHASRHAKKHTGKRDAECPECHRCFTRKDNMEQHRRTHNKENKKKKSASAGLGMSGIPAGGIVSDLSTGRIVIPVAV